MPKCKCKYINNAKVSMSPLKASHNTTANPKYSNIAEAQENCLEISLMIMTGVLKEEMTTPPSSKKKMVEENNSQLTPKRNLRKARKQKR